jgi:hypothetical protein
MTSEARKPMSDPDPAVQAQPPGPANEVKTVEVIVREKSIEAPASVIAGALTFSFSNATSRERTAAIEGKGGPWRIEHPIPPQRSMTLEVMLEPGDYVLVSRGGESSLTLKFRVLKPGSRP